MSTQLQLLLGSARRHAGATFLLLLVIVLGTVNYSLWRERADVTRRHGELQRQGEAMLFALTDRPRIAADLAAAADAQQRIDRNLISETGMAKSLGYFFQLETFTHVRLSQLNQLASLPSPTGNPFKAIPFSLRVTGTYAQIIGFIRELETGPRLARIRSFSFVRADPKTNALALDLTVELLGLP